MSETTSNEQAIVKLDTETSLLTSEGRVFLNQIASVSSIMRVNNTSVEFLGEELVKTGYVSDCKRVQLIKCPAGYFLFADKTFTKNNWSVAAPDLETLLQNVPDREVRTQLEKELSATAQG